MLHWVSSVRIDSAEFLVPLYAATAAAAVYLLVRLGKSRWVIRTAAVTILGGAAGLLFTWLIADVWNAFGVSPSAITRMWVAFAGAGVALAAANLWGTRWSRKAVAVLFVPAIIVTSAAGINVDFGTYPRARDAAGIIPFSPLPLSYLKGHAQSMDPRLSVHWQPPAGIPTHGIIGTVTIPAPRSHFLARRAVVYLPPAALVPHPPVLPVVMLFSGQPGSPTDVFASGHAGAIYDAYAAAHGGLAPIVVVADQLGYPGRNPMCTDSTLGNAGTYLTVDVPNWIRNHLRVAADRQYWGVGGYSEGGTCAIQFGAGRPDLFGSIVDVLGELQPSVGSNTVSRAFGGSATAYSAVKPLTLLAVHAPYSDTLAIFGTGARDTRYTQYAHAMETAASNAGMNTELITAARSGHDWNTVRYVWSRALPQVADRMGLAR